MSKGLADILAMIEALDVDELTIWIERGWVRPMGGAGSQTFSETDVARVRLIHECIYELGVETETLPLVLSLLDQVYGLRRELAALAAAVDALPDETRTTILQHMAQGPKGT